MSGVLQMYVKLFDHMLATAPTPTPDAVAGSGAQEVDGPMVKQQLQYLRDKVQKLQRHRYKEQEDFLKNLTKLDHIKVPADRTENCRNSSSKYSNLRVAQRKIPVGSLSSGSSVGGAEGPVPASRGPHKEFYIPVQ